MSIPYFNQSNALTFNDMPEDTTNDTISSATITVYQRS